MNNFKQQKSMPHCIPTNTILDKGNYHFSYEKYSSGYGTETTAIVLDNNVYFVLVGDHTKQLNDIQDINQAIDYFVANIKLAHNHSEHLMITGLVKDPWNLTKTALKVIGQDNIDKIINSLTL
jgi:hypothetical protein